jgi:hypothetical protein
MNASIVVEPNSYDRLGALEVVVVYGDRSSFARKENVASIYRCHNTAQLASLLNAIALDMSSQREITQIIFLDESYKSHLAEWDVPVEDSIERGSINLPVESVDEYCVSYRLV